MLLVPVIISMSNNIGDSTLNSIMSYLSEGILPDDSQVAAKTIVQALLYTTVDGISYYVSQKSDSSPQVVMPSEYKRLIEEYYSRIMTRHFSVPTIYKTISRQWWWDYMYQDIIDYTCSCPHCAIVTGAGRRQSPQ